jgi:hypothetical protein
MPSSFAWIEKRAWTRRRSRFRVFLACDQSQEPCSAWVVDRSPGGLRLLVPGAFFDVGAVVRVRPIAAPPAMPWIAVQVKNCRSTGDAVELGCKFLQAPSLVTLLMFG